MASELRVDTLKDSGGNNSVGMSYVSNGSAKSYCRYEQDSSPLTEKSFNIASVTDSAKGTFEPNFTNNMSDALYLTVGTVEEYGSSGARTNFVISGNVIPTASKYRGETYEIYSSDDHEDAITNSVTFGDLA